MNKLGSHAEALAKQWLLQQGLCFVRANYQLKFGEIDLIMSEGDTLAFIEVRQRGSRAFGGAAQSVTASKQQKLIRCAQHYLQCHDCSGYQSFRFDVLAFETSPAQLPPIWYKDAFRL